MRNNGRSFYEIAGIIRSKLHDINLSTNNNEVHNISTRVQKVVTRYFEEEVNETEKYYVIIRKRIVDETAKDIDDTNMDKFPKFFGFLI